MNNLRFFTGQIQWSSANIRARQIADRLNVSVDSFESSLNDGLVFVKCYPDQKIYKTCKYIYIDVVDSYACVEWLSKHPKAVPIVMTEISRLHVNKRLNRDDAILIPQQHCNFEQRQRERKSVSVVGYIGEQKHFHLDVTAIEQELNSIGLDFVTQFDFPTRESVCEFYKKIDIQLCYRQPDKLSNLKLKDALKLHNAGSFSIPTVACFELGYNNVPFIQVSSLNDIIKECKKLKNNCEYYKEHSVAALKEAESFHINKIIPFYKQLISTKRTHKQSTSAKRTYEQEIERAEIFQVKIYKAAAHLAKMQKVRSVLDLGCGYPVKLQKYLQPIVKDITGVDLSWKIKSIQKMKFGKWIIHDLNKKDLNLHRKFDMIISADVIEHLDNPNRLLNALKQHSTKETIILLSTPDAESTAKQEDGSPANTEHIKEWKMSAFINYLSQSGFEIIDFGCYIETNGSYPWIANYFLCRVK